MKIFRKKDQKEDDLFPVAELIRVFPGRFVESETRLSLSWFPVKPIFTDQLMSSYGVIENEKNKEFVEEYFCEISFIMDILEKHPAWQVSEDDAISRFWNGVNMKAHAMAIWDSYAIPYRTDGDNVFIIWSPSDVEGSPIIKEVEISLFLVGVAVKTSEYSILINKFKQKREKSLTALGFACFIILMFVLHAISS